MQQNLARRKQSLGDRFDFCGGHCTIRLVRRDYLTGLIMSYSDTIQSLYSYDIIVTVYYEPCERGQYSDSKSYEAITPEVAESRPSAEPKHLGQLLQ